MPKDNTTSGLQLSSQKLLLLDIKAKGGLAAVCSNKNLKGICNKNKRAFGEKGTPLRQKVWNWVQYLKDHPETYQALQFQLLGLVLDDYSGKETTSDIPKEAASASDGASSSTTNTVQKKKMTLAKTATNSLYAMSQSYGQVEFDHTIDVKEEPWKNPEVLIWKSNRVLVGKHPTINALVYVIML